MTNISEGKGKNGKLYVSAIFDCFDAVAVGLSLDTNMKAQVVIQTLENACKAYPKLKGAIVNSNRGTQYTSKMCRTAIAKYGIIQNTNVDGGRYRDC